jgi:hypothetical protein
MVEPVLARNGVTFHNFEEAMREGNWKSLLFLMHEMLIVWKNSFADSVIEESAIQLLRADALTLL